MFGNRSFNVKMVKDADVPVDTYLVPPIKIDPETVQKIGLAVSDAGAKLAAAFVLAYSSKKAIDTLSDIAKIAAQAKFR